MHLDDAPDDREPEPAAAAARLVGTRAAKEPVEDSGELRRFDADARINHGDRRRTLRLRLDLNVNVAASRRELDRVADEVRDDLPDADRVVAELDRLVRAPHRELHPATSGRCGRLVDRLLHGRAQVLAPKIEQHEPRIQLGQLQQVLGEPVEALQLHAAGLEELGARRGIVRGALHHQFVERSERRDRGAQLVRDIGEELAAPITVAANDLDALLESLGHRVELEPEVGQLDRAAVDRVRRDAPCEIALSKVVARLGEAPQRRRDAAGERCRDDDRDRERDQSDHRQQAGDVGDRRRTIGIRVHERDFDSIRRRCAVHGHQDAGARDLLALLVWQRLGLVGDHERAIRGGAEVGTAAEADSNLDVGLPEPIGDQPLLVLVAELREDDPVHDAELGDDGPPGTDRIGALGDQDHVVGDARRARLQVRVLLLVKVRSQPVDDEQPDEPERDGDNGDEAQGQPALEGLWGEALDHRVSARRTRTRHRGWSGRTPDSWGHPRACRAGGSRGR